MKVKHVLREDTPVRLLKWYLTSEDGGIKLMVEDAGGTEWYVAVITPETGKLCLCTSISDDIGLPVDKDGCIQLAKERI